VADASATNRRRDSEVSIMICLPACFLGSGRSSARKVYPFKAAVRRLSSIFIPPPSVPTADLTTLPQKLAFSGNDASSYGCPKNALCLGGGSGPIVGAGVPGLILASGAL